MDSSAHYRFVVADDHPLFRGAHARIGGRRCSRPPTFSRRAASTTCRPCSSGKADVDLVLLDLAMPGVRGFSGLLYLRAQFPGVPVDRRVRERGARRHPPLHGVRRVRVFCRRRSAVDIMRTAIRRVLEGGVWTPPDVDLSSDSRRRDARSGRAPLDADAAAGARADDAVGRTAQQADRVRTQRVRGDREGARLGNLAEARTSKAARRP